MAVFMASPDSLPDDIFSCENDWSAKMQATLLCRYRQETFGVRVDVPGHFVNDQVVRYPGLFAARPAKCRALEVHGDELPKGIAGPPEFAQGGVDC